MNVLHVLYVHIYIFCTAKNIPITVAYTGLLNALMIQV